MSPSAVIDSIPLDTLWRCSEMILHCPVHQEKSAFPVWIFLCAALLFGFAAAAGRISLKQIGTTVIILVSGSIVFGGTAAFLLPVPNISPVTSSLVFLLTFSSRILLQLIVAEVSGTPCFRAMIPANVVLAIAISCLTTLFALTALFVPSSFQSENFLISLAVLVAIAVIVYIFTAVRILFLSKTPLFYAFLYLCTLEIIPVAVVTVMLARALYE